MKRADPAPHREGKRVRNQGLAAADLPKQSLLGQT